ncbi:hypothetical protein BH23ACT4_BH23ACT4_16460 [soil metagenome]
MCLWVRPERMDKSEVTVTHFRSRLRLRAMRRITTTLLASMALLLAACGADVGEATTTAPTSTTTTTVETTTTTADTTTTTQATTTTLAGEPIDFGPAEDDIVMVIGVAYDDVLNLRAAPGANQPISDEIPPTFADLVAQGNTRDLSPGFWIEVDYEGTVGWVNFAYTAFEGEVTDETSAVIDELGERPVESTMTDLAEVVADVFNSDDELQADIIQVTEVVEGDLTEVTYDVVGLGDDAVAGFRLHIFAEKSGGGFTLRTVEVTLLCARAVADGLCV